MDARPEAEAEHYAGVTDLLVHLHARPPMDGLPVHGLEQWLDEVMLLTDWYCPAFDLEVDRDAFRSAWEAALHPVEPDRLPRRSEERRVGDEGVRKCRSRWARKN